MNDDIENTALLLCAKTRKRQGILGLADCLSRFPIEQGSTFLDDELVVCKVECVSYNTHGELVTAVMKHCQQPIDLLYLADLVKNLCCLI